MLTPGEIRELRQVLREQEFELHAKMRNAMLAGMPPAPFVQSPATEGGRADTVTGLRAGLNDGAMAHGADALLAIHAAKVRMKDKTYGICIECHHFICFDRLLMLPTALRCLSCQDLHESGSADRRDTWH